MNQSQLLIIRNLAIIAAIMLAMSVQAMEDNDTKVIDSERLQFGRATSENAIAKQRNFSSRVLGVLLSDLPTELRDIIVDYYFFPTMAAAGYYHSLFLIDGKLWGCGESARGQLGLLHNSQEFIVTPMELDFSHPIEQIAAYSTYSLVLTQMGKVWMWGKFGDSIIEPIEVKCEATIKQIAGAYKFAIALSVDGEVWVMRENMYGTYYFAKIELQGKIRQISTGFSHWLALSDDGKVFAGVDSNDSGQFGIGTLGSSPNPAVVASLAGHHIIEVAAGDYHSLAMSNDGIVFGWGENTWGELGNGQIEKNRTLPVEAFACQREHITAGNGCSFFITADGRLLACGMNQIGQLGTKLTTEQITPVEIIIPGRAVQIALGLDHTIIVTADRSIWVCGSNREYKIGIGHYERSRSPYKLHFPR